ncbi:MAG: polyamine aminopropyltransferase [Planctomycetota bacterium]
MAAPPAATNADWFTERHHDEYSYGFALAERLVDRRTAFQHVEIAQTRHFGRMLVLDGAVQLVESMEFVYHESLVHPAMTLHPNPRRVLVVGGGDGGTAREALRHPTVDHLDMVDIDGELVALCREYLPTLNAGCFDDPRLALHHADGAAFLGPDADPYDVILTDFTDPVGPAETVYQSSFFESLRAALAPGGLLGWQCESVILLPDWHRRVADLVGSVFPATRLYHQYVQMYGGLWSFAIAAHDPAALCPPVTGLDARLADRGLSGLRLYSQAAHDGMFDGMTWAQTARSPVG